MNVELKSASNTFEYLLIFVKSVIKAIVTDTICAPILVLGPFSVGLFTPQFSLSHP